MTDSARRRILLLLGAEADQPHGAVLGSESTPLASLLSSGATELDVISLGATRALDGVRTHRRLDESGRSPLDAVLGVLGAFRLRERLATFPVGRLFNSIGPVAPSRVFWRTLRHDADGMHLLRAADVVVASDLETTKAAWIAVHRGWVAEAFYDHRAVA